MSQRGDQCTKPKCTGRLRVRTSEPAGDSYIRRLECNVCGAGGGKEIVPAARVFNRKQAG